LRDDSRDAAATRRAVAEKISAQTTAEWAKLFEGRDICCCVVSSVEHALADPHFIGRGLFAAKLAAQGRDITALPVPVAPQFRAAPESAGYPALGEANSLLGK